MHDSALGEIRECDVHHNMNACLSVTQSAAPIVSHVKLHHSLAGGGLFVFDGGQGVYSHLEVYDNKARMLRSL